MRFLKVAPPSLIVSVIVFPFISNLSICHSYILTNCNFYDLNHLHVGRNGSDGGVGDIAHHVWILFKFLLTT